MVYIGLPTNPQFLRDPAERIPAAVAQVIGVGVGQSGRNPEYLYLLEKALEGVGLGTADGHVTELVRLVKGIERHRDGGGEEATREEEARAEREVKRTVVNGGSSAAAAED
jgi:cation transport protein ChaC